MRNEPSCDGPGHAPTGMRRPTLPLVIELEDAGARLSSHYRMSWAKTRPLRRQARAASHAGGLGHWPWRRLRCYRCTGRGLPGRVPNALRAPTATWLDARRPMTMSQIYQKER